MSALSATKKEFLYEKETEFTGFCHPAACRADLHQLHGHQQNRSAVRGGAEKDGPFLLLYGAEIGVLGIYALCWQQVIKRVELSVAYANRAMALLWSLLWAVLLFGEQITVKKLIGVGLVLAGTLIINGGKEQENHD